MFASAKEYATRRLKEAAEERGLTVHLLHIKDIVFLAGATPKITWHDRDIAGQTDIVIIRGTDHYEIEAQLLAEYLEQNNVTVLDKKLGTERYLISKLAGDFMLSEAHISHPSTAQALARGKTNKLLAHLEYPILVKDVHGTHSKGIYALKTAVRARKFFRWHDPKSFIIQEYLPTLKYLRVMMVGDKAIAAIRRYKKAPFSDRTIADASRANYSAHKLTASEKKIAQKAHATSYNDVSGIDILSLHGHLYIAEVNRVPEFEVVERATKVDIAGDIIDHALKRWQKEHKG